MRRTRIFWGIIVILAGVVLLLNALGLLPRNFGSYFWPLVLILLGVWALLGRSVFASKSVEEKVSIPLEGAASASIELRHGAGRLKLGALDMPGALVEGNCTGGVETDVRRSGSEANVVISAPEGIFPTPFTYDRGFFWDLGLARDVPIRLRLRSGANEALLNLTQLKVTDLTVETGASSTEIDLPAQAGFTRVKVSSGAARVQLRVPEGVAASIQTGGGLATNSVNELRFPRSGSGYETPGYATAANRVEIHTDTGVGSVEIR